MTPPGRRLGPSSANTRSAILDMVRSGGTVTRSEEVFFTYRTDRFEPATGGHTALERSYILGHRWCDATIIADLVACGETVYPVQLGERLAEANALADGQGPVTAASAIR